MEFIENSSIQIRTNLDNKLENNSLWSKNFNLDPGIQLIEIPIPNSTLCYLYSIDISGKFK